MSLNYPNKSKKKKLVCGYRECDSEIKANSGCIEVVFRSIEGTNPQPDVLKPVKFFLCHKHMYELAAVVKLFDQD